MRLQYLLMLASALVLLGSAQAYYNITAINTTVTLSGNSSAHVIETFSLYISNSSVQQYVKNRDAVGLSLSDWQSILYTTQLTQHIISVRHSTYGFTFLPGPLVTQSNGGEALLTMSYYLNNVTSITNIAPRKFKYTFNDSVFNFENTASGQTLPYNTRLNIVIPTGAQAVSIYPLPDLPTPTPTSNYNNFTSFSWFSGEPLSQFSFSFIMTQSLQDEVLSYFSGIYQRYAVLLYVVIIAIIVLILVYVYLRAGRDSESKK